MNEKGWVMRITLLFLCLATLFPSTSVQAANASQDDVIALQGITVTAEKQREMLARLIKVGLSNSRSERAADVDKIVCILRKRTGSHLKDLQCATNSTMNYMREMNLARNRRVFGNIKTSTGNTRAMGQAWASAFGHDVVGVNTYGVVMTLERTTRGKVMELVNEYAADDTDTQNHDKLVRDMVWANFVPVNGRHGYSTDDYTGFAMAYRAIKILESEPASNQVTLEVAMADAIQKQGPQH